MKCFILILHKLQRPAAKSSNTFCGINSIKFLRPPDVEPGLTDNLPDQNPIFYLPIGRGSRCMIERAITASSILFRGYNWLVDEIIVGVYCPKLLLYRAVYNCTSMQCKMTTKNLRRTQTGINFLFYPYKPTAL